MNMPKLEIALGAALLLGAALPANAEQVKAGHAKALQLGTYQAVVYFEEGEPEWQVVTTIAGAESAVRYISRLAPGESDLLTVAGEVPITVKLVRSPRGLEVETLGPATAANY